MVTPHNETEEGNRDRTERNEAVTEDGAVAVDSDDFADDSHGGQNHDVHRRMAIEPEEVLVQDRIATHGRVEDSDVHRALNNEEQQGDTQHRSSEHLNDGGCINRPQKQRHAEPGHSRRTQFVNRDDEVQTSKDGTEAKHECRGQHRDHATGSGGGGVRRIESPTSIKATHGQRDHAENRTSDPQVVTKEVQAREGNILGTKHDGQNDVAERCRDTWNDHQEHHDGAVQGEPLVVGVCAVGDCWTRGEQLRAKEQCECSAEQERTEHRPHVHHTDAFVVKREDPRQDPACVRQVIVARGARLDGVGESAG